MHVSPLTPPDHRTQHRFVWCTEKDNLFQCHRQKQREKPWSCAHGQTGEMLLLEEHSSAGTALVVGTVAMAVVVAVAMSVIVAMSMVMAVVPRLLVGPVVGIDGHEAERGEELGELQAAIVVAVRFGKELLDVLISSRVGLREDKMSQGMGSPSTPTAPSRRSPLPITSITDPTLRTVHGPVQENPINPPIPIRESQPSHAPGEHHPWSSHRQTDAEQRSAPARCQ